VNAIESDLESEIRKRVNKKVSAIKDNLERDYRDMEKDLKQEHKYLKESHWIGYITAIIIMCLSIIGVLILSKPLRDEMEEFFTRAFEIIGSIIMFPVYTGKFIAIDVFEEAVNSNGYIACMVITGIVLYAIMIVVAGLGVRFLYINIKEDLCDEITAAVLIIINAAIVFFTPVLTKIISINLLYLGMWIIIGYVVLRFMLEWNMEQTKKRVLSWILIFQVIFLIMKGLFWIAR
jgi:hypothetical protein